MASPHLGAQNRALLPKKLLHERLPASSTGNGLLEVASCIRRRLPCARLRAAALAAASRAVAWRT
eukprot:7042863-Prymnesium_polylepis.1